ncbi:hypothetical protein J2T17_006394 [Paenibacillus mucilaginosus]|uniref:hypothetical protein n=1 Tax=Paenibacillus mucilaginosus TaxID=61624 RepID=UPI003D1AFA11
MRTREIVLFLVLFSSTTFACYASSPSSNAEEAKEKFEKSMNELINSGKVDVPELRQPKEFKQPESRVEIPAMNPLKAEDFIKKEEWWEKGVVGWLIGLFNSGAKILVAVFSTLMGIYLFLKVVRRKPS